MSDTRANIEVTASSNRLAAGLRKAMGMVNTFSRGVGASMKKIGESSAGSFVGNVGANLAGRGMDFVSEQAAQVRDFESSLTRYGIAAGVGRAELAALGKTIRDTSDATGINANEIARAAGVYFDLTSDSKGAGTAMQTFARIAAATGSGMEDIAKVGAAMSDSLGITADEMEGVFGSLIAQGKAGKIGLKDMAAEFTSLLPKFSRFKGALGAQGMVQLGAAFQVASKGFGTASEAATGLEALMGALSQNAAKFKGVKIFDVDKKTGVKTFRNLHDIIVDIGNSKLAKDPTKLSKAFGSKEAEAAFFQLNKLRGMYDEVARAGTEGAQSVGKDFETWIESPAGKIERALERVKNKIAEALTPERIEAFAEGVEDAVRHVTDLADGLGKVFGFLGTLNSVGKSVRGFFSGNENGNPFGNNPLQAEADRRIATGDSEWILTPDRKWIRRDSAEGRAEVGKAQERSKNRSGYNRAVDDILAGEINERTSPESIRRAVRARYSANAGEATAGNRYLANVYGGNGEQVAATVDKVVREEMQKFGLEFVKGLQQNMTKVATSFGVTLNMDGNQVAKASNSATDPRRKGKP